MVEQDLLESIFQFGDLIIIVDIVAYTITHVYIYINRPDICDSHIFGIQVLDHNGQKNWLAFISFSKLFCCKCGGPFSLVDFECVFHRSFSFSGKLLQDFKPCVPKHLGPLLGVGTQWPQRLWGCANFTEIRTDSWIDALKHWYDIYNIYIYYSWYTHACIYIYTPTYIYISWLCITIRIHRISYHVYMIHYESSWIIYYSCYAIVLDMIQLIDASIQEQATFYWTYIDAMDTIIYGISVDIYPPVIKHGFHDNPPFSSMIFPLSLLITGGHSHYIISPFLLLPC